MPRYVIDLTDEQDAKMLSEFGSVEGIFRKVIADACQHQDSLEAEAQTPKVARLNESEIAVVQDNAAVSDILNGYAQAKTKGLG